MPQMDPYDGLQNDDSTQAPDAQVELRKQQEIDDLKWLMSNAQGRRIASRILERTGNRRSTFHTSGSVMAFNEGRRDIGLWFESELVAADDRGYFKMLREYTR